MALLATALYARSHSGRLWHQGSYRLASTLDTVHRGAPCADGSSPPFYLPETTSIVPDDDADLVDGVDNHPVSGWRPQNQFASLTRSLGGAAPVFALGTIVSDPSPDLQLSYDALRQSSLTTWIWFIVDHGSTDAASLERLDELAASDERIELIRAGQDSNPADLLNGLLKTFVSAHARCAMFLQSGAMVEHTILEKMAWSLASVATWDLVGHFTTIFGDNRTISTSGLHSGADNLHHNLVPSSTAFRVSALKQANCRFDGGQAPEGLLWDFFMCWAAQDRWGGVSPIDPPHIPD